MSWKPKLAITIAIFFFLAAVWSFDPDEANRALATGVIFSLVAFILGLAEGL